ncbi:hypothetical protein WJX79_003774 [Trebouxia sp. C0005]
MVVAAATAQSPDHAPCAVSDAFDFQSGIANADECSTLELQNSVALTANSFSSGTFVINNQNITITASEAATNAPITLDFGTYALNGKILVTGTSIVTNYTNVLATPRTAWLNSLDLQQFQGSGQGSDGVFRVQHALAPLTFDRENLTTTLPAQDSGTVTFDNCTFSCPTTTESASSYAIVSRVWTPLELLSSVNLADSRMLLLQQSIATANNSWGSTPVLIAESMVGQRMVYIVGVANATLQPAVASLSNSSSPADSLAVVLSDSYSPQPTPDTFFTWTINDNTDLLQVGYLGSLTLTALTLKLPEPCCVTISLPGSWYFSNQPLPWNIFGTVLPGAFSVQAVRIPQLNVPAYMVLRNVTIVYASCDASFAAAADLLVSKATIEADGDNGISFSNQTLVCNPCIFQGSEQVPSVYSNAVSQVELYDTNITCLNVGLDATSVNGTDQNSTRAQQHTPAIATAGAAWAPPVWLPVLLAVATSVLVTIGLAALWRRVRRQREADRFTSLRETVEPNRHLSSRRPSAAASAPVYVQRTMSTQGRAHSAGNGYQVQSSKLSNVYPATQLL